MDLYRKVLGRCTKLHNTGDADRVAACMGLLELDNDAASDMMPVDDECSDKVAPAVVIWLLKTLSKAEGDSLPLSELLVDAECDLVSFFREAPVVVQRLRPYLSTLLGSNESLDNVLRLREWQETLVSLAILSKKYKDLFWRFFKSSAVPREPAMRAGWLLFLLVKTQLLPNFPDIVSSLQLMVCALNMLVAAVPLQPEELARLKQDNVGAVGADGRLNTLKAITDAAKMDYANAQALMPRVEQQLKALLEEAHFEDDNTSPASQDGQQGAISPAAAAAAAAMAQYASSTQAALDTQCAPLLQDVVLQRSRLQGLVLLLDSHYQALYSGSGEIDEREFLTTDFGALASPRAARGGGGSGAAAAASGGVQASAAHLLAARPPLAPGAAAAGRKLAIGLQSPLPLMHLGPLGAATPISATMGAVSWLRNLTRELPAEPPASLQRYLEAAGPDAAPVVVQRVQAAAAAVFTVGTDNLAGLPPLHGMPELQQSVASERREEALKLYWHVLESMLRSEERSSGVAGIASLVTRWSFHQCLLACSFEILVACYRMGSLSFPKVAERLRLQPFDMTKMIAPFVHCEPSLPRELKHHLFTIEEKVIESLAWQPGSSIYRTIIAATSTPAQRQRQHSMADTTSTGASASASSMQGTEDMQGEEQGPAAASAAPGPQQAAREGSAQAKQQMEAQMEAMDVVAADTAGMDTEGGPSSADDAVAAADAAVVASGRSTQPVAPDNQQPGQQGQQQEGGQQQPQQAGPMDTDTAAATLPTADNGDQAQEKTQPSGPSSSTGAEPEGAAAADGTRAAAPCRPRSPKRTSDTEHLAQYSSAHKRQRGNDGAAAGQVSLATRHAPLPAEVPLPRAVGAAAGCEGWRPAAGDAAAQAVMQEFCRKVLKLAAFRLVAISDGLDFRPMDRAEVLTLVYEVVAHSLHQHTCLFYGRHLDQILLSALYGFCKVNRLPQISFKEIIAQYRRQPHAKQEVFRTVTLEQTDPGLMPRSTGDIIAFYNQVFVPTMKSFLLGVGNTPVSSAQGSEPNAAAAAARARIFQHQQAGHTNRSPILVALASQQQQQQQQQGPGQLIVKRAVGQRAPLQPVGQPGSSLRPSGLGGSAYRALSLDPTSSANAGHGGYGGVVGFYGQPVTPSDPSPGAATPAGDGSQLRSGVPELVVPGGGAGASAAQPPLPHGRAYVPSRLGKPPAGLVLLQQSSSSSPSMAAGSGPSSSGVADAQQQHLHDQAHGRGTLSGTSPRFGMDKGVSAGAASPGRQGSMGPLSPGGSRRPKGLPPLQLHGGAAPSGTPTGLATLLQALDTTGALAGPAPASGRDVGEGVSPTLLRRQQAVMQE